MPYHVLAVGQLVQKCSDTVLYVQLTMCIKLFQAELQSVNIKPRKPLVDVSCVYEFHIVSHEAK